MNNPSSLNYQVNTDSYGQVRAIPLVLANELNSKLERWFQNCKYTYLAISNLTEEDYNKHLQLEYIYSRRVIPLRDFSEIKSDLITEIDLLNYHQLIKIVHEFIEKTHNIYQALKQARQGDTILHFQNHIDLLSGRFDRANFPEKLKTITTDLEIESSLSVLKQINRVRNCLEHRSGIVSKADCDPGKEYMSICWRYLKISSAVGEMTPISNIKGKQQAETNFTDEEKRFRKGEKIVFDFHDNSKCIFSVNICFKEIIDAFYKKFNVDQEETPTIIREFNNV